MSTPAPPEPTVEALREALTQVLDPEVGVNIVDLGLVYDIRLADGRLEVDLTMTTPACPMGSMIAGEARDVLAAQLPAGTTIEVRLVWDPPWEPAMMSAQAREHFGW